MNELQVLAAVAAGEFIIILALLRMLHGARRDAIRSVDRLLLLGKSSTPGEAIASYERLNRIESIRGGIEELLEQRRRSRDSVARKEPDGARWFGMRRRRAKPPETSGG
jgi:hypothetical protein